jgi:hypothetical protein
MLCWIQSMQCHHNTSGVCNRIVKGSNMTLACEFRMETMKQSLTRVWMGISRRFPSESDALVATRLQRLITLTFVIHVHQNNSWWWHSSFSLFSLLSFARQPLCCWDFYFWVSHIFSQKLGRRQLNANHTRVLSILDPLQLFTMF